MIAAIPPPTVDEPPPVCGRLLGRHTYQPAPEDAHASRLWLRQQLSALSSPLPKSTVYDLDVVAGEFAANVVRHARTMFEVRLYAPYKSVVRIEFRDWNPALPTLRYPVDIAESGRGLSMVVPDIAATWGWYKPSLGFGKIVYADVPLGAGR